MGKFCKIVGYVDTLEMGVIVGLSVILKADEVNEQTETNFKQLIQNGFTNFFILGIKFETKMLTEKTVLVETNEILPVILAQSYHSDQVILN